MLSSAFGTALGLPNISAPLQQAADAIHVVVLRGDVQGRPRGARHGGWEDPTPSYHPFLDGIFPHKPSSYWGTPIYGNPSNVYK